MQYRLLGSSGLRVSDLALGTMTFSAASLPRPARPSPGADWSWCATEDDARRIFERYVEAGGNFIDTADVYAGGTAEPLVGALVASARDQIVLATKCGLSQQPGDVTAGGSSYRTMVRAVDASLRRLGTDRIDLLWLHAWDGITPLGEVARGLDAVVRSGKVLYVGLSDTPAWAIAFIQAYATAHALTPITAVQLRYNVVDRAAELELLPMCRHLGVGVVVFGVLAGGALTRQHQSDQGRRGRSTMRHEEITAADAVADAAESAGCTPAQVALAWVRSRAAGAVPIIGARVPSQLDELVPALDVTLSAAELDALDAIAEPPAMFPHDVVQAVKAELRGGSRSAQLIVPHHAAF